MPMDDFLQTVRELLPVVAGVATSFALVAAIAVPVVWVQATQEAAAFNRFTTGPKATAWDAVWVQLRVEALR